MFWAFGSTAQYLSSDNETDKKHWSKVNSCTGPLLHAFRSTHERQPNTSGQCWYQLCALRSTHDRPPNTSGQCWYQLRAFRSIHDRLPNTSGYSWYQLHAFRSTHDRPLNTSGQSRVEKSWTASFLCPAVHVILSLMVSFSHHLFFHLNLASLPHMLIPLNRKRKQRSENEAEKERITWTVVHRTCKIWDSWTRLWAEVDLEFSRKLQVLFKAPEVSKVQSYRLLYPVSCTVGLIFPFSIRFVEKNDRMQTKLHS